MQERIKIIGDTYGDLTVIREVEGKKASSGQTQRRFLCRCKCGNELVSLMGNLRNNYRYPRCKECGTKHAMETMKVNGIGFYSKRIHKKKPSQLSEEDIAGIHSQRITVSDLATKYNVGKNTIRNWLFNSGVVQFRGRKPRRIIDGNLLLEAVDGFMNKNWNMIQFAKHIKNSVFSARLALHGAVLIKRPEVQRKRAERCKTIYERWVKGEPFRSISKEMRISRERIGQLMVWYSGYLVRDRVFRNWLERSSV